MSVGLTIFILTLVPIWAQRIAPSTDCTENSFSICSKPLLDVLMNKSLNISELKSKMNQICLQEQVISECIHSALNFCPDDERALFRIVYSGYLDFMTELCSEESNLQKQYLDHVECFRNFTSDPTICQSERQQFMSFARTTKEFQTRKRKICCSLDEYRVCFRKNAKQKCGKGGAELLEKILAISLQSIYLIGCSDFEQNSPNCLYEEKPSSAFQFASNSYLLPFAVFITIGQFY